MAKTLRVEIVGDSTSLERALSRASAASQGFGASISRSGQNVAAVGATLTRKMTLPIVGLGVAAGKLAYDFDRSMTQIKALVGASDRQMAQYRSTVLKMAKDTGKLPKELADALYFVTSSGFKGAAALRVLQASARASAAGMGETRSVADAVTSAVNAYGEANLSASEATDILLAAVREGKNEPEELASTIGRVIAPAQHMGVEFREVAGALASLSLVGIDADEGVTALRGTLLGILHPAQQTRTFLKENGESLAAIRQELQDKGLLETFGRLAEKFKGNQDAIGTLFPSVRALNGFLALTGKNAENTARVMGNVARASGDTNRAFAETTQSMSFRVNQSWASIQASLIRVGSMLLPIVANMGAKIASVIEALVGGFDRLPPTTQTVIAFGIAATAALGPVLSIIGNVTRAAGGLTTAFTAVAAGNPMALALTGLGIAAAAVAGHFIFSAQAARNLASAFEAVKSAADPVATALDGVKQANLNLTGAHNAVIASSHGVEQAERQLHDLRAAGKTGTLEYKLAQDQLRAAHLQQKQALLDLGRAQTGQQAAQTKATGELRTSLNPVLQFGQAISKTTGFTGLLGAKLPGLTNMIRTLSRGFVGNTGSVTRSAADIQIWGKGVETAGMKAWTAANKTKELSPAGKAAHQVLGLMTAAAGTFARSTGQVPTRIGQIVEQAKKSPSTGRAFEMAMKVMVDSAKKAGVEVPKWMQHAATHTKTQADKLAEGVSTAMAPIPGYGSTAGQGAGANLASGLRAHIPDVAAAAAALRDAAKVPLGPKFGSEPDEWGAQQGTKLARGFAGALTANANLAADASEKSKEALKARVQAQSAQLVALVRQYGHQIGYAQAAGVVQGILHGTPGIVAQARQALQQATAAARQAVVDARASFVSAFESMANQALAAFDAKWQNWKPPSQVLLDKMQIEDQVNQAKDAITQAQAQLDAANQAAATYKPQEEETPEQIAADQKQLNDAVVQAQAQLTQAIRAQKELQLQMEAAEEQKKHDALIAKQRENLAKQLAHLEQALLKHPEAWRTMHGRIKAILDEFGVHMVNSGTKWADNFADGIRKGIPAAEKAARDLAAAVDKYMPHSPAKEGPLAYDAADSGRAWSERFAFGFIDHFGSFTSAPGFGPPGRMASPVVATRSAPASSTSSGGGGGGLTVEGDLVIHEEVDIDRVAAKLGRRLALEGL